MDQDGDSGDCHQANPNRSESQGSESQGSESQGSESQDLDPYSNQVADRTLDPYSFLVIL
jgi:hypothetical protein